MINNPHSSLVDFQMNTFIALFALLCNMHPVCLECQLFVFVFVFVFLDTQVSLEPTHVIYNLAEPNITLLNRI